MGALHCADTDCTAPDLARIKLAGALQLRSAQHGDGTMAVPQEDSQPAPMSANRHASNTAWQQQSSMTMKVLRCYTPGLRSLACPGTRYCLPLIAMAPRSVADRTDRLPMKAPTGVLTAEMMHTSVSMKKRIDNETDGPWREGMPAASANSTLRQQTPYLIVHRGAPHRQHHCLDRPRR